MVEPADYQLKIATNHWMEGGKEDFTFTFKAVTPGVSNLWTGAPRGTVVLLHGYGVAVRDGAVGVAAGGGRLALRAGGPARPRQIHGETDFFRGEGGGRPERIAG